MSWNDTVIEQFRANDGKTERFGSRLVLLHTTGAKSGEPRIHPLMAIEVDGGWLVGTPVVTR